MTHPNTTTVRRAANYCGIDLVKFLCTFLVVAIHFQPFSRAHFRSADTMNFVCSLVLARVAVPFFFMSTGFFLLGTDDPDRAQRYCLKLLRIYAAWTMLLILGSQNHLWYIRATVVAVFLSSFCLRRMKFPVIAVLALGLYAIGLLGDSYYGLVEPLRSFGPLNSLIYAYELKFGSTRNGLFMGFPFVLMGAWFARTGFTMRTPRAALGLALSLALMVAEAMTLEQLGLCREYNMYLMLLPASFFFFALALSLRPKPRPLYDHLRTIGALNYYVHIMVAKLVGKGFTLLLGLTGLNLNPYLFPAITAASLLTATAIYRLSRREQFRWVQYLYR